MGRKKNQINKNIWRPPVVGLLGHVDHGKTTLLDAIRNTAIQSSEAGGITQHISWSSISWKGKDISFIDTPGHQSFTIMREVGGKIADIVLLVVSADAGVQPQTKEAIEIIKEAKTDLIVVVTKIDTLGANVEKVKKELSENDVLVEGWGGEVPIVEVSATEKTGIDELMDMIILVSEMKELKYHDCKYGLGVILDTWVDRSKGKCSDVMILNGKLSKRQFIKSKVGIDRASVLLDGNGNQVTEVLEGYGVRIICMKHQHLTGSIIYISDNEKTLDLAEQAYKDYGYKGCEVTCVLKEEEREIETIDDLFAELVEMTVLNYVVKTDTQGVLDAILREIQKLTDDRDDVKICIVGAGVGNVGISDLDVARVTEGTKVLAFNVHSGPTVTKKAKELNVEIVKFEIIYKLLEEIINEIDEVTQEVETMKETGRAKVKQIFALSNGSVVAGSQVTSGTIKSSCKVKIMRDGEKVIDSNVTTIRVFKDKVNSVKKGQECGIVLEGNEIDIKEGDEIVSYIMVKS